MNVIIEHYKKADNGIDTVYHKGKPIRLITTVKLPLNFGYGSYNEPKKVFNCNIDVDDIISIVAEGELNITNA
jgi:ethanolamine utilization protein EutQ (cupin superfamily)